MGKVKGKKRTKLHSPAVGSIATNKEETKETVQFVDSANITNLTKTISLEENPFKSISISKDAIKPNKQFAEISFDDDITEESVETRVAASKIKKDALKSATTKLERRKLRREMFLKKLDAAHIIKKEKVEAKKRSQVAIIGDVNPMKAALDDLLSLPTATEKKKPKKTRLQKKMLKNKEADGKLSSKDFRRTASKKIQKHKVNEVIKAQKLIKNSSYKGRASDFIKNAILANIASNKL